MNGWIAVDLDGVLAEYHGWPKDGSIGAPVPAMLDRVKNWLSEGKDVRIFTARAWPLGTTDNAFLGATSDRINQAHEQVFRITEWCKLHIGKTLPVTCIKDFSMIELWDDRCVQVELNTGQPITAIPADAKPLVPQLQRAWKRYTDLFGEPPHGTEKQLSALVALMGNTDDRQDSLGIHREIREGQEPLETKPDAGAG